MDSSELTSGVNKLSNYRRETDLKYVVDALPHFSWIVGPEGVVLYCNKAWRAYSGIEDRHEAYENLWKRLIWPEDWAAFNEWYTDVLAGGTHASPEIRLRSRDPQRSPSWFLLDMAPLAKEAPHKKLQFWLGICTDITARKQAMDRAAEAEQKFKALFNSNVVGMVVSGLGHDDIVQDANEMFLHMLGYTTGELERGEITWEAITPPRFNHLDELKVREVLQHGSIQPFEKCYRRKDGSEVPVLVGAARINPDSLVCVNFVLDVTRQKELERRKDEFMGMASHELKTPIAVQKLYIHMLSQEVRDHELGDLADVVQKIERQTEKLDTIVAEMIDLVRIEANRIVLNKTPFDPDVLIKEIVEELRMMYGRKNIEYTGSVGEEVCADRERIGQVITNLISNAVKYSPDTQPIKVHAMLRGDVAHFCVQDSGIGIDNKDVNHVFDRFYRVEGASERTYPGMGVGLFIAADILRRHGGRIWVESEKGKGSTFFFDLPLMS